MKKIIYIFGPDGAGKTTICRELSNILKQKGIPSVYRWMRFNHYLTKIVNLIGRITKLSYYESSYDGIIIGYHEYGKSKFLKTMYIISTLIDSYLSFFIKIFLPASFTKKVILVDRFVIDIIVDLSIDLNDKNFYQKWPSKLLRKLVIKEMCIIYLNADENIITNRRPDVIWDKNFKKRYNLYKKISTKIHCFEISNNSLNTKNTISEILKFCTLNKK